MKIEQFIYTNLNRHGRGVIKSSVPHDHFLGFLKIIKLFYFPDQKTNVIFSRLSDKYFLYCQCKEYGREIIANKKGRTAEIYFCFLVLEDDAKKLNYDFSLFYLLLSKKIDWELVENNIPLKTLNIEFNKKEIEQKLILILNNNCNKNNKNIAIENIKYNLKIISNRNIYILILISSLFPEKLNKRVVLSSLKIHSDNNPSLNIDINSSLYSKQLDFLRELTISNYRKIKKCKIIVTPTPMVKTNVPNTVLEPIINKSNPNLNLHKKITFYLLVIIGFSFVISNIIPFIEYSKLNSAQELPVEVNNSLKSIEKIKKYKQIINNGVIVNSLTDIVDKYESFRNTNFINYYRLFMKQNKCEDKILPIMKDFIIEYKNKENISILEKKLNSIRICSLKKKILRNNKIFLIEKNILKERLEISRKIIRLVNNYKNIISGKIDDEVYDIYINQVNFYEKYFLNKIKIKIKILTKNKEKIDLIYLSNNKKEKKENIYSNKNYIIDIEWSNNFFIKINGKKLSLVK